MQDGLDKSFHWDLCLLMEGFSRSLAMLAEIFAHAAALAASRSSAESVVESFMTDLAGSRPDSVEAGTAANSPRRVMAFRVVRNSICANSLPVHRS